MQDNESALVVLRRAIHNEVNGQRFYSDAAHYCIDPWTKEMFASMAEEEIVHTRLLLLEYDALTRHGRWIDPDAALTSDADVDITAITFPEDELSEELFPTQGTAGNNVDRRSDDLAALAFGINMEKMAIDLYGRAAKVTEDQAAQKAYRFLVLEETRHYDQLRNQWEELAGMPFEEV
ncbi:ferritin family protein [Chloroflexota bacterium]